MKTIGTVAFAAALAAGSLSAQAAAVLSSDLQSFAVLGAAAVTNVPNNVIVGNLGVSPGSSITGFLSLPGVAVPDPQVTSGNVHATTALAGQAQSDLTTARNALSSLGAGTLLGVDLVGLTILPGVYTVPAGTSNLTGAVTLDGQGDLNALWVFQFASTLITSPDAVVNVINTGSGAGVFWNVGSSATLDLRTAFQGNILSLASITMKNSAKIGCGRALAETGAVTMDMNTVNAILCDTVSGGEGSVGFAGNGGAGGVGGGNVPEPATSALVLVALIGVASTSRRRAQPVLAGPA